MENFDPTEETPETPKEPEAPGYPEIIEVPTPEEGGPPYAPGTDPDEEV